MPSVDTLVADLDAGTITAIGAVPRNAVDNTASLSDGLHVTYSFTLISINFGAQANKMTCEKATNFAIHGSYLFFEDARSTVTKIDNNRRISVSGGFGGCAYRVYRTGANEIRCVHIARPGGNNPDVHVQEMTTYANNNNWTLLQQIDTVGHIGVGGCEQVMVVTQLKGKQVQSILIELSRGNIIRTTDHTVTNL